METFSVLLALCAGNSLVSGEFHHKGQWHGALMFSFIWVNNREAGDFRCHRAHDDVTVMYSLKISCLATRICVTLLGPPNISVLLEYNLCWGFGGISRARIINHIPKNSVWCKYLCMAKITTSGTLVLNWTIVLSSAVIMRPNVSRYYIRYHNDSNRT